MSAVLDDTPPSPAAPPRPAALQPFPLNWKQGDDPRYLREREWITTNGLGGYAGGTLTGSAARRYHGLFIPSLPAPYGRTMMIPFLEDQVSTGGRFRTLGEIEFAGGRFEGDAAGCFREFRLEGQTPIWQFEVDGRRIERRIAMPQGQNTVCVSYSASDGQPMTLRLRPYVTFRGHSELGGPRDPARLVVSGPRFEVYLGEQLPLLRLQVRPVDARFVIEERRQDDVFLRIEHERGYDYLDYWRSPGYFELELNPDTPAALVASTEPWEALELKPELIFEAEGRRCERLIALAAEPLRTGPAAQLVIAADQFLVFPGTRLEEAVLAHAEGTEPRTVIAGYPWFTDWGRDTMISLEGLTLVTGRAREARWILRTFAHYMKDGLIPNNFPEGQRTAVYHTVDATLWYFHALDRFYETTHDRDLLAMLFPMLSSVIEHHVAGTHFGIHMDIADGLISAGADGYQLTWMDAKVDDWVVTPRRGKPVEIQALWYNALQLMAHWAEILGQPAGDFAKLAGKARESFNRRFWIETGKHLYDVIDGPAGDDSSFRPNQIFSLSLRFPILDPARWRAVVDVVGERLLTPYGLRTLDRSHPDYKKTYMGNLRDRDAAYHQGTVWPWLIGPFVDAWRRVHAGEPSRRLIDGLLGHLGDAGVGTIGEIFDAEEPYRPRGCHAQAWSVAETLRVLATIEAGG